MTNWPLTTYLLLALGAAVVAILATWAHFRFWTARLSLALDYDVEDVLPTPDGAHIELRRVPRPAERAEAVEAAGLPPVLLVHGLGANHRNQDLHPDWSLARHLAALGRDVWLVTLRSGRLTGWLERRRARFGAMVKHDVPMAVDAILGRTGKPKLDYVGFSMGGMLLYAALGRTVAAEKVRRVVIIGSPGQVRSPTSLVKLIPRGFVPTVPVRSLAQGFAFASEWARTPLHGAFANPRNMAPGVTRLILMNLVRDIPSTLQADFLSWAAGDGEIRVDGERALDGLAGIGIPVLFFAGSADRVAPERAVRHAFEAWGRDRPETPKRMIVLGRDFGQKEDYGHGDLAVGAHVAAEIFEPVARFLGPEEQPEAAGAEAGAEAVEEVLAREPVQAESAEE
ncbi:alpha/beta fold hydrolase [Chondromyces crocatus]|nr:alpha/beta fold hydrolase [Chondromyces crocatus]